MQMSEQEDVIHLVNKKTNWELRETATGTLTDGTVSEDLQRDRVHQILQWLQHFPDRLPEMEALTVAGERALSRARSKNYPERDRRW
jgi:hypothetical protein